MAHYRHLMSHSSAAWRAPTSMPNACLLHRAVLLPARLLRSKRGSAPARPWCSDTAPVMALCLRPFVSLRDFRIASACRQRLVPPRLLRARPFATGGSAPSAAAITPLPPVAAPKYASLSAEQQQQVDAYLDILLDWNQRMNLTGRTARGVGRRRVQSGAWRRCCGAASAAPCSLPPSLRWANFFVQPLRTARRLTSGT